MKIRIEQSGGFTGIPSCSEMNIDNLPPSLETTVRELLNRRKLPQTKNPKGAADYLNYKITFQNGTKNHVIECNEFDIHGGMKSLVEYVQKNAMKKR